MVYLVLDPAMETFELVAAGHLPPLLIDPSGEARFVWPPPGVPLGALPNAMYRSQTCPIPTGTVVLLYTDGLVERRREVIDDGLERLRVLAEGAEHVETLCASLVEHLVPEAPDDDVAFIAVRVPPLPDQLATRWRATPDSLAPIRYLLRRWLAARGATEQEAYDLIVATQEACANAIEHAYGPARAHFELAAGYDDGLVTITVTDTGRWRAPRGENRGRGLPMMRALAETVDVRQTDGGTAVTLTQRLGTPA